MFAAVDLPPGLTIDAEDGVISGVPTQSGTSAFTVHFRDLDNRSTSKPFSLTVNASGVGRALPDITNTDLANGQQGVAYSTRLGVTDNLPGTWVHTGSLPSGLALNPSTGVISGTPTTQLEARSLSR